MGVLWAAPVELNGPPPVYHVERTDVSFSDAEGQVIRGSRFTGTDYFHFPSSTLPLNTDFTGTEFFFSNKINANDKVGTLVQCLASQQIGPGFEPGG